MTFVKTSGHGEPESSDPPCGWYGAVGAFLAVDERDWLACMAAAHRRRHRQAPASTQRAAWMDCRALLEAVLGALCQHHPGVRHWGMIFEYELPREGGRRTDLVLLVPGRIAVLEFKQGDHVARAALDQVMAYARDLASYHTLAREVPVVPVLVPTGLERCEERCGVAVRGRADLGAWLESLDGAGAVPGLAAFLGADYAPLPTLVDAARRVFRAEPLPDIRRAASRRVGALVERLHALADRARSSGERHLVLVSGVPGAGKTLVGLQFVHQQGETSGERRAVYLSGNDPLVAVLQYALRSRVFVQPVRAYYRQYGAPDGAAPPEPVIVFDEAQRAWDGERMQARYGIDEPAPRAILRIMERLPGGALVVVLLGEGQEIHVGEEGGIQQWREALAANPGGWRLRCPPQLGGAFQGLTDQQILADPECDLDVSLRTHRAFTSQRWLNALLTGDAETARARWPGLEDEGLRVYLTRDLAAAKDYCRRRYADAPDARFGLLASSRARNLPKHGIPNDYQHTRYMKLGPWYCDPPDSPDSCRQLAQVATEFACQGLELDFGIVCWGGDLRREDGAWRVHTRQRGVRDPLRLRLNSYRVLLSRGRDGMIVWVPPEKVLDETYGWLREVGIPELPA